MRSTRVDRQWVIDATRQLVFHSAGCYFHIMRFALVRRISAVVLALALAMGPAMYSVHASAMTAKMAVAASSDMHSPGKCDHCVAGKAGLSVNACSGFCSGLTAFSSTDNAVVFDQLPIDLFGPFGARKISGHADPPDPYPPRSSS